jgi:RNA polymerase sigma-70 factor (ECF subfamily)
MRPAQETIDIGRDLVSLLPRLRRFALTLTRTGAEADELVQAVCDRAMGRQPVWNGNGRLETALYTLARTLWADQAGKRKSEAGAGPGALGNAAHAGPVQKMIMTMPDGLASIFLLVAVEGHTYREAGAILGLPPETIADRLATARSRLATIASDMTERRA